MADGQIVDLSEHWHDAGDEIDRRSEVGGGRQQRRPAVLRDGGIPDQRDRQPKVAGGMSSERRPCVSGNGSEPLSAVVSGAAADVEAVAVARAAFSCCPTSLRSGAVGSVLSVATVP